MTEEAQPGFAPTGKIFDFDYGVWLKSLPFFSNFGADIYELSRSILLLYFYWSTTTDPFFEKLDWKNNGLSLHLSCSKIRTFHTHWIFSTIFLDHNLLLKIVASTTVWPSFRVLVLWSRAKRAKIFQAFLCIITSMDSIRKARF